MMVIVGIAMDDEYRCRDWYLRLLVNRLARVPRNNGTYTRPNRCLHLNRWRPRRRQARVLLLKLLYLTRCIFVLPHVFVVA